MDDDVSETKGGQEPPKPMEALGKDAESWGWDVGAAVLQHAGMSLGRYPPYTKGETLLPPMRLKKMITLLLHHLINVEFSHMLCILNIGI